MAPIKPKAGKSQKSSQKSFKSLGPSSKTKKPSLPTKSSQVKTKRTSSGPAKPKKRVYSEKELGIPALNMITPAGVQKPKGKKKGKVFVDDQQSMMTILALVNAEKEGQIESKLIKARQLEEIREARRQEAEARQEEKRSKFEEKKDSLRKKRKSRFNKTDTSDDAEENSSKLARKFKKRVSFG